MDYQNGITVVFLQRDKMKIATFGCSWTHGTWPDNFSWAYELAKLDSTLYIDDYSKGGTSLDWSISQLLKTKNTTYDYKIIQITAPYRFTFAHNSIDYQKFRWQRRSNCITYSDDIHNEFILFNNGPSNQNDENYWWKQKEIDTLSRIIYSCIDEEYMDLQWLNNIKFAQTHCNLILFHFEEHCQKANIDGSMSSERIIGNDFNDHCIDDGYHLDESGSKKIAEWIYKRIK